jgi:hypothetical protein
VVALDAVQVIGRGERSERSGQRRTNRRRTVAKWKAFAVLLARAQEAHAVRTDVGPDDVALLLAGAIAALSEAGDDRTLRRRAIGLSFDSLRP